MIETSLIIVNYNGAALLPACLDSALATIPTTAEIVVVDNASQDASLDVLAAYGVAVRVVAVPRNLGFGRACNLGVAAARGDTLVFLNPDVSFPTGWLAPLLDAVHSDLSIGFACPEMLWPGQPLPPRDGSATAVRAMLPGCGLTARRAAWSAIGGFDERMFLYWEDSEICWRAWLLGWKVVVAHHSFVYHTRSATTAASGCWDGERARNSLLTYLTLLRWRVTTPFATILAAKTLVKYARTGDPALIDAWRWNLRHRGATLARRRALAQRFIGDRAALERLIAQHARQFQVDRQAHA